MGNQVEQGARVKAEAHLAAERGARTVLVAEVVAAQQELAAGRTALAALQVSFEAELRRSNLNVQPFQDTLSGAPHLNGLRATLLRMEFELHGNVLRE